MANWRIIKDGERPFGEPPVLKITRNGWVGARELLVETEDEYEAIASCPQVGAPWSATLASCVVTEVYSRYISRKDFMDGTGGLTVVHLDYAEPGTNGTLPPPQTGLKFTVLGSESGTVTIYSDLRAPSDPGSPPNPLSWPLSNGDGASKQVGRLTAQVYVYIPLSTFPSLARIAGLLARHSINSDDVTLPNILGTSTGVFLAPGQCQYDGFAHQLVGAGSTRAIEIVHSLVLAPDFYHRWKVEDEEGNAQGEWIQSVVCESEPFAGLW